MVQELLEKRSRILGNIKEMHDELTKVNSEIDSETEENNKKIAELEAKGELVRTGTLNDTINAVEDLICDEMALELAFEGTRFGDLTRLARHKNKAGWFGTNYGSKWLANKLAYKKPTVDLKDEKNWFLPFQ